MSEYLLRVKALDAGGFAASCSQLAGAAHPEVRAVIGRVGHGLGDSEALAIIAAVAGHERAAVVEVRGHAS